MTGLPAPADYDSNISTMRERLRRGERGRSVHRGLQGVTRAQIETAAREAARPMTPLAKLLRASVERESGR